MNKIHQAFDEIQASEELKASAIAKCKARKKPKFIPQTIAACIAFAVFLSGAGVFKVSTTEAAYISLDINPSIGLSLNSFKRVISSDAYNDEAKEIISELDLKGKKYDEAVQDIMNVGNAKGYDVSKADIYIESNDDSISQEINTTITKQCPNANTSCHNAGNREKASEYNISPGKYYLIEQILPYGGTIDDYKDKQMRELKEIYSDCTGETVSHNGNHYGQKNKHGEHGHK